MQIIPKIISHMLDYGRPAILKLYFVCDKKDKDLLCDLYQYQCFFSGKRKWNPKPFVGNIQLKSFT